MNPDLEVSKEKDKSHSLDGLAPKMAVSNPRTRLHFYKQTPQVRPPRHTRRKPNLIHTQPQREKHQRRNKVADEIQNSHQFTTHPPQSSARGMNAFLLTSHTSAPQPQKFHSQTKTTPHVVSFHCIFPFDTFSPSIHNSLYVTCGGRISPRFDSRSITDGAKIYSCYWRCCFLTGKRRSCLLHRLSPRKSRLQSHPAKVRSVPQRRSRHYEPLPARRSLRHRRRR